MCKIRKSYKTPWSKQQGGHIIVIWEIISNLIGMGFGVAITKIYEYIKFRRPLRKFWRKFLKEGCAVIVPSVPESYSEASLLGGVSDLRAQAEIAGTLSSLNPQKEIRCLEARFAAPWLSGNLVLIGGPITNSVTRRFIQEFKRNGRLLFDFQNHDLCIYVGEERRRWMAEWNSEGDITLDYGLIYRGSNPYDERYEIIILAGCHGFGTYGAAKAVLKPEIVNELAGRELIAVIKIHVYEGIPQTPILVFSYILKR